MKKIMMLVLVSLVLVLSACTTTEQAAPAKTEKVTATTVPATAPATASAQIHQVVIENFKFSPADLEIKAGDTVEWVNKDGVAHTVTLGNGEFDEKVSVGATVTHTFTDAGNYAYHCSFHPNMRGSIAVS
ncbi:cupredoxin domain-containing protein [Candidatus Woesearchaeota archaeon]|nr:cupredoxin domain-containing protein [Candidatus Woesearchaeota archaeon]